MVGSPRSWDLPYLVLNLTLIVKSWSVLVKTGWYNEEALSVGGTRTGVVSKKKSGAQSDSSGMIFNSIERKS